MAKVHLSWDEPGPSGWIGGGNIYWIPSGDIAKARGSIHGVRNVKAKVLP